MTLTQMQDAVRNKLAADLPAALALAGLSNFSYYGIDYQNSDIDDELLVLLNNDNDTRNEDNTAIFIRAQLLGSRRMSSYADVIKQFILDELKPHILGFTYILNTNIDFWPLTRNTNLQFIFFSITYTKVLDDCN